MPSVRLLAITALLFCLAGCGYHTAGSAVHLPATVHTLEIPIFQNHAQSFHTEVAMTQAVIREFTSRTSLRVVSTDNSGDAVLRGTAAQLLAQLLELVQWPGHKYPVLVIGHQPMLGQTIAQLLGLKESECAVKKGALWWLRNRERDGQSQTVIVTVQSPEVL